MRYALCCGLYESNKYKLSRVFLPFLKCDLWLQQDFHFVIVENYYWLVKLYKTMWKWKNILVIQKIWKYYILETHYFYVN